MAAASVLARRGVRRLMPAAAQSIGLGGGGGARRWPPCRGRGFSAEALQQLAERIRSDGAFAERIAERPEASALIAYASQLKAPPPGRDDVAAEPERDGDVPRPTMWQYRLYFFQFLPPFIGFGLMDNAIMLLAGDYIDSNFSMAFGISTLAAAGIGNTFSDVIGIWVSGVIESCAVALGIPDHGLTFAQRNLFHVRILKNSSMIFGTVVGCTLGMFPLLWPAEMRLWPARSAPQPGSDGEDLPCP